MHPKLVEEVFEDGRLPPVVSPFAFGPVKVPSDQVIILVDQNDTLLPVAGSVLQGANLDQMSKMVPQLHDTGAVVEQMVGCAHQDAQCYWRILSKGFQKGVVQGEGIQPAFL